MRSNTKFTHIESNAEISAYLDKRVAAIGKFVESDQSAFAQIELAKTTSHHRSGDVFRAEINMHTGAGDFYAVSETGDLKSAIDGMRDEVMRQLHSKKDKRVSFARRSGSAVKNFLKGIVGRNGK